MTDKRMQAIRNAAASFAMERMPLSEEDIQTVVAILEGKMTLDELVQFVKEKYEIE